MRLLIFILFVFPGISCNGTKNVSVSLHNLDGKWIPVRQEMAGTVLPSASYAKQQLLLSDSNYIFTAESVDKGIAYYKDGKMDIYGRVGVNAGKHFRAIYKFDNGHLMICYNLAGDSYPEGFETTGKRLFFLSEFLKEEKK